MNVQKLYDAIMNLPTRVTKVYENIDVPRQYNVTYIDRDEVLEVISQANVVKRSEIEKTAWDARNDVLSFLDSQEQVPHEVCEKFVKAFDALLTELETMRAKKQLEPTQSSIVEMCKKHNFEPLSEERQQQNLNNAIR